MQSDSHTVPPVSRRRFRWVDPIRLSLPGLPEALRGLRLLHVSDIHYRRWRRRFDRLLEEVREADADILALTGDYQQRPGNEGATDGALRRIAEAADPHVGAVGVFGNHDSAALRDRARAGSVHWLRDEAWVTHRLPLTLLGVDAAPGHPRVGGDLVRTLLREPTLPGPRLRVLLAHYPWWLLPASDCGIDLVLSGHTHGGQLRLPGGVACYNGSPGWPLRLSSGLLRRKRTHGLISRGVGEDKVEGLRSFCPRQVPLLVLDRAAEPPVASPRIERRR